MLCHSMDAVLFWTSKKQSKKNKNKKKLQPKGIEVTLCHPLHSSDSGLLLGPECSLRVCINYGSFSLLVYAQMLCVALPPASSPIPRTLLHQDFLRGSSEATPTAVFLSFCAEGIFPWLNLRFERFLMLLQHYPFIQLIRWGKVRI